MYAKKASPTGSSSRPPQQPRHEPDLSHLATRKVDTVSSLAAEMMLRQADEDALLSSQKQALSPPEAATPAPELPMQTISPFPPASSFHPPAPSSSSLSHQSVPPPAWSTVRATALRSEHSARSGGGARVAILVLAGLLLATLSAAAAFVLTR